MVAFGSLIGTAALFAGYASALPRPEWASSDASAAMSSDVTATAAAWGAASSSADSWGSTETAAATAASSWGSSSEGSMGSKGKGSSGSSWSSSADSSMSTDASSWGSSGSSGSSWGSGSSYGSDSVSSADSMSTDAVYATAAASATSYAWSYAATATAAATSSISYGSGSSNWGGSGYENCVQQCMATFGAPSATITAAATSTSSYSDSSSGSSGSGTTHTVIVAPTQGVLRFVPFAVNATPGDTIFYMWNANNHTVTKGSELEICNETSDAPFATGEHDKGFTFTETVNDTNPVFFFCSTPTHCEKGMFGIINPPSVSNNVNTSAASIMPAMMANSSSLSAMYAASNISSNSQAASWGSSMDIGNMPSWSQSYAAENIMYTRAFLAANPSVLKADGSIDMSATNGTWNLPQDISAAVSSNSTSSSASASSTSSSAAAASSSTTKSNGARANAASGALVGIAAVAAAFLAL